MSNKRWLMLAIAFLAPFAFLFTMQTAPPLFPSISKEFGLTHAAAAGVMLFVALPAVFLSIPGGFLTDKYGSKKMGLLGLALVFLGAMMTAIAPSFGFLQVGRAIVGIGGALLFAAAPPLIFQWFSGREIGLAMGIWALTMPLATTLSFNLMGRVELAYGSWRAGFWISTVVAAVILLLYAALIQEKRVAHAPVSPAALKKGSIWMLAFVWGSFNVAAIGLTSWGKTLFMDFKGIPPLQADFLAGMIMLMAFATPLSGYLAGRLGRRRLLIIVGMLGVMVTMALVPAVNGAPLVALLVVLGLFTALAPPSIFALPPDLIGHENVGLGFGVLNTGLNIGVVLGPLIVGQALDITHSEMVVFLIMAFFAGLAALFAFLLKAR
ncbi:MAG: MFS transporter [Dehalococcoidia bacterium]|nr:MFS transporter [Dehalococcoidia bacterium]